MKVSTVEPEFQPVVITLETQEEVDQMFALANFNSFEEDFDITLKIFELLINKASDEQYGQSGDSAIYKVIK